KGKVAIEKQKNAKKATKLLKKTEKKLLLNKKEGVKEAKELLKSRKKKKCKKKIAKKAKC
uniref:Uncharacterized protein n=1 Tax=Romanomermis culicivorax TaxID=13658 RepID=A0A915K3W8_ROMCU